jgi:hypothetical protein
MTTLYHYCSNAAFLSIISSREIFASEFTLSNDSLEGKWVREVVKQYASDIKLVEPYHQAILLQHVDVMTRYSGATGICLSEEGDLLSQWRGYADDANGVSIGFDSTCFGVEGSTLPSLRQVIYDSAAQRKLIQDILDSAIELVKAGAGGPITLFDEAVDPTITDKRQHLNAELISRMFHLSLYFYQLKNPAFSEEKEWRSISSVPSNLSQLALRQDSDGETQLHKFNFRALRDRIVPYKKVSLDNALGRPAIKELILGPRNLTPLEVAKASLIRNRWPNVEVKKSIASYR